MSSIIDVNKEPNNLYEAGLIIGTLKTQLVSDFSLLLNEWLLVYGLFVANSRRKICILLNLLDFRMNETKPPSF